MTDKIAFGLVGCGRIGERHAKHINNYGRLAAVCDVVSERADALAGTYNAKAYYSLDELLSAEPEIKVISICTPNGLHAQQSIQSLNAARHVLCEKPMAISVADCGEMIKAAERKNKRLFVIKQNRFNPPVAAVKKIIDEGKLGKLFSVQLNCFWNRESDYYKDSWRGTLALDGGTLFTQFSHFIDLLYWLVGDIKDVFAITQNFNHEGVIEFEDTGVVSFRFHNGVLGTLHYTVNAFGKNMEGSLTIFGEKGTIKIGGQYLNELEYQLIEGMERLELPAGNMPNDYGKYTGSMSNHDRIYENVVDVMGNGGTILTNLYEGLKTVEIIEKIYESARKNK